MQIIVEGKEVLFDDCDTDFISDKHLYLYTRKDKSYVLHANRRVHRILLGIYEKGVVVDHRNGNPLDNRRENLRVCIQKENSRNRSKSEGEYTSKYKGVHCCGGSWIAQIRVNYKKKHLGTFRSEIEAAEAYNVAAVHFFGDFAKVNNLFS